LNGEAPGGARDTRWYGRRLGRPLRPGRRALLAERLPGLAIPSGEGPLDPASLFSPPPAAVWLEIGFGAGEHLAAQAAAHPEIGFIGAEPYLNGVAAAVARLAEGGIGNVRLWADDVRPLLDRLVPASIGRVYALFPDPWPKTSHRSRRLIGPEGLARLARVMADGAELRFASDDMAYVRWVLDWAGRHPEFAWTARRPGDWRQPFADGFPTRYEAKASRLGRTAAYLAFRRLPRNA